MLPAPWPRWFRKFGAELISVIPHTADSDTIAKRLRGKCPGTRKADGKWMGTTGTLADRRMTEEEAKIAHRTGAVVGMLGRKFPALDIDTSLPALAQEIADLADMILGSAPCRGRDGSPRRLLMYAGAGHRRRRLEFRPLGWKEGDKPEAIEWLGDGQYYNVEGMHQSDVPYEWLGTHPCDLDALSEADAGGVSMLFEALPAALERHGCVLGRASVGGAKGIGAGSRDKPLSDPTLWHPAGPAPVLAALAADPDDYDYDHWVTHAHAYKAALGPDRELHYGAFEDWSLQHPECTPEAARKVWDSIETSRIGHEFLRYPAEVEFVEHTEAAGDDLPADPGDVATEQMLARFRYARKQERFVNIETGEELNPSQFNSMNTLIAPCGTAGPKSAHNQFLNHPARGKACFFNLSPGRRPDRRRRN